MRILFYFFMLLTILSNANVAFAVVFVDGSRSGGDGSSWVSAYKSLESAIAGSGTNEEFWIAAGTYKPGSTLSPKEGSSFYGGFAGNETSRGQRNVQVRPVIVDGQQSLRHVFSIVGLTPGIVFDGLTITGGRATGSFLEGMGGGIFINVSSAQIVNCTFTDNTAEFGGAIYSWNSQLVIDGCVFTNNHANSGVQQRGGAIWLNLQNPQISNCTFSANSAGRHGGAIDLNNTPDATISFSTFTGNLAGKGGGGVALFWDETSPEPSVSLEKCLFKDNRSNLEGGGVYSLSVATSIRQCDFINNSAVNGGGVMLDYKLSTPSTVNRSRFLGNSADGAGGALHSYARSVLIENSLFAFNSAPNGGALRLHAGDDPDYNPNYTANLINCTLYGNSASFWGGAIAPVKVPMLYLTNCILWGNQAVLHNTLGEPTNDVANNGSSSMTIRTTDMESLDWNHGSISETHVESFSADPLFVDPDGVDNIPGTEDDNFQLQATSACIDRADSNYAAECDMNCYPQVDHSGISNTGIGTPDYVDIGALERIENPSTSPCPSCVLVMPYIPPEPSVSSGGIGVPIIYLLLK